MQHFSFRKLFLLLATSGLLLLSGVGQGAEKKVPSAGKSDAKTSVPNATDPKKNAATPELTATTPLWRFKAPQAEQFSTVLGLLAKELEGIAADAASDSKEGRRRVALQKRSELLGGWQEVLARQQTLEALSNMEPANVTEAEKRLQELRNHSPTTPPVPENPTPDALEKIQGALADRSRDIEAAALSVKQAQQLLQETPQKMAQAKEKAKESAELATKIAKMSDKALESGKSLTDLQTGNAELEQRFVQDQIARFQAEEMYAKLSLPRREKNLEVAQLLLELEQKRFNLYHEALDLRLERERQNREAELQKKLQAEEEANTPQQKFLTRLETEILQVQRNIADLQQLRSGVVREISEQEKRLQAEKSELENLKALVRQYGSQGPAAELLKGTYRLLKQRHRDLRSTIPVPLEKQQERLQERRLDLATRQAAVDDEWLREKDNLLRHLTERQREGFARQSQKLLDDYHHTLSEEKRLAFEVSIEWQRLALLPHDRQDVLDELESFVLANVFWIQDADPFSGKLFRTAWQEVMATDNPRSLRQEWRRLADPENWQELVLSLKTGQGAVMLGSTLVVLPWILFFLYGRLQRSARSVQELSKVQHVVPSFREHPFLIATLQSTLMPAWLLLVLLLLRPFIQVVGYQELLERGVIHLSLFLFLWSMQRRLPQLVGCTLYGFSIPEDLVRSLRTAARIVLWAFLLFMLPRTLLDGSPFALRVLPRIFSTLFAMALGLVFYLLVRPGSPLLHHTLQGIAPAKSQSEQNGSLRHPWISWVWWSLMASVIGLDVTGYRFGAMHLARNSILTLATVVIFMGISRSLDRILERLDERQRVSSPPPDDSGAVAESPHAHGNVRRFARPFLLLSGLFLIASYWGVNEQALTALSQINLYSVTGTEGKIEFVTVADLVRFALTLILTFWLLANLSGLLHFLIFSRWQVAEGSRYAVVMITRYTMFIFGIFMAVSWMRLDPGRLGWLMAALGVGLGFGLQEIVANFVSGIILLVERPIRVSDLITVGEVTGTVTQINIRATRVQNIDNQEILIPNRELITRQVTNWTLSNTSIRLTVPVGVAYGTPIEKVREILLALARQQPEVMATPPPRALFMSHGESSLNFELWVFLPRTDLKIPMLDRLNTLINAAFVREGIEIPFPQRDIHVRSWPVASGEAC
ncbi:MAG: mechanosensitive ion channel [Magnetococcales bacterium]|nr:mechanosensitive ion channel [Magnetococcales bacterium]